MAKGLRFKTQEDFDAMRSKMKTRSVPAATFDAKPKRSKYRAEKVHADGITFDSIKEFQRYKKLKQMQDDGEIHDLECHKRVDCDVNGNHICRLEVDFAYRLDGSDAPVYEDVKGYKKGAAWTIFRLKQKLCEALHGIKIDIV